MQIKSKDDLIRFLAEENRVKYILFWGHTQSDNGVMKTCFSQWYESKFTVDGVTYPTAEHFMMAQKAALFGDKESQQKILQAANPGEAKKRGRGVTGFDEALWVENRFDIVVAANKAKFSQNPELNEFLLSTGDRVLVEASPVDRVWGIGLAADHPDAENPHKWRGLNLLGFALMQVRDELQRAGQ